MNSKLFNHNDILETAQGFDTGGLALVEVSDWTKENSYSDFEYRYIIFREIDTGLYWRFYQHRIGSEFTEYTYDNAGETEVVCFQVELVATVVEVWELVSQ